MIVSEYNQHLPNIDIAENSLLKKSAILCFLVIVVGQWIFLSYVIGFYGYSIVTGNFAIWNEVLPKGYIPGDTLGNLAVACHMIFAIIILLSGPLQFIPAIRARFPKFHHWNGRIYISIIVLASLGGLFMVWTRGSASGRFGDIAISVNALFIIVFALFTVSYAIKRNILVHQRWALRLFMVVSGVWFFRVGLMFWLLVNKGPVGFDLETFQGPFLWFLSYAQYILPLLILEIYFLVQKSEGKYARYLVSLMLLVFALILCIGIFAAAAGMWLPRIF